MFVLFTHPLLRCNKTENPNKKQKSSNAAGAEGVVSRQHIASGRHTRTARFRSLRSCISVGREPPVSSQAFLMHFRPLTGS